MLVAVVLLASGSGVLPAREPRNLDLVKNELREYVESGEYLKDLAAATAPAKTWLQERIHRRLPGEKFAIVFDLDETLLSNWPELRDTNFDAWSKWDAWVERAAAPANEPVREVYQLARQLGVNIYFLTGRTENQRAATEKNLKAIGCAEFAALIMRPTGDKRGAAEYKTGERKRLTESGQAIIASLGDQESDLAGGYAERTFKLPDPFYLIL